MGGGASRPRLTGRSAHAPPIVIVAGPTASGKSALALAIARQFDGVVLNADSMQVYRDLAILTARPGADALAEAPHRLYGVLSAAERCSVGRWREMAVSAMADAPGRLHVVVGGTGLYLRALMEGLAPIPDVPATVSADGAARLAALGARGLHSELAAIDPTIAARLEPADAQRILRAWCVHRATGRSLAEWQVENNHEAVDVRLVLALMPPREALYAACNARFDRMVEAGAIKEVGELLALGLDPSLPAMKAVGVRELAGVLREGVPLQAAVAAAQQETRRYAKRQMTWIRHQMPQAQIVAAQFSERILPEIFANIRQSS
jgi:tRNA dimethylallyltransferase